MLSQETVQNLVRSLAQEGELLVPDEQHCFVVTDYTHRMAVNPGEKTVLYRWETPLDPEVRARYQLAPEGPEHLEFTVPLTQEVIDILDARIEELQEEQKTVNVFLYGNKANKP